MTEFSDIMFGEPMWYYKPQDPDLRLPCVFVGGDDKTSWVLMCDKKEVRRVKNRYLSLVKENEEAEWENK